MNIHEYQAKALLRSYGAPVSDGRVVLKAEEAKTAAGALDGPLWVVKAQIHAGGRGKGSFKEADAGEKGGVRLAKSVEEAEMETKRMLGRTLVTKQTGDAGKQVNRIYIEDGSGIETEMYLALLVDRQTSRVSFVASTEGGMDIEEVAESTPEKILSFSVDPATGYQAFHGRRIAFNLGLTGKQVKQCVALMGTLYKLFIEKDMEMLEINPLIVTDSGDLKCLDAKMGFDGNAVYRHPDIAEVIRAGDATSALRELNARRIDAVFLDINMPGLSGIELAGVLANFSERPAIVFVTAHDDKAVAAFDVGAIDYLLKPIRDDRLDEAVRRAAGVQTADAGPAEPAGEPAKEPESDVVPAEVGGVTHLVPRDSIGWVEAEGDYARLHSASGSHLVRIPLSTLETRWRDHGFQRVHRSYLVALRLVTGLRSTDGAMLVRLRANGASPAVELPVSRRQARELRDRVVRNPMRNLRPAGSADD